MKCPDCNDVMENTVQEIGGANYEAYLCQKCNMVYVPFSHHTLRPSAPDPQADEAYGSSDSDEEVE